MEPQPLPPFAAFPSIPRLYRECVVTEKIDGTNASVHVLEDGTVLAGSRNRYLTIEADNFGFARWVKDHEDELRTKLGFGRHFGEWYGSGIQKRYSAHMPKGEKRFALFNVAKWRDNDVRPLCCDVVPVLYEGPFDTAEIRRIADILATSGSIAVPGCMQPEGVVVYHVKGGVLFKYTLGDDGHKSMAAP